jgi:hypothetical protein
MYLPMVGSTAIGREMDFDDPTPSSSNDANDELTAKSKAAQILATTGWHPDDVLECVGLPNMRWIGPPAKPVAAVGAGDSVPAIGPGNDDDNPQPGNVGTSPEVTPISSGDKLSDLDDLLIMEFAGVIKDAFTVQRINGHELEMV